jgi:hypothetical protein
VAPGLPSGFSVAWRVRRHLAQPGLTSGWPMWKRGGLYIRSGVGSRWSRPSEASMRGEIGSYPNADLAVAALMERVTDAA